MKRPNLFSLSVKLNDGIKPIREVAVEYLAIITELSKIDKKFSRFVISKEGCVDVAFDITGLSDEECIERLSDIILDLSINDILKFDSKDNPDINYNSSFGFSWIANFSILAEQDFYLIFRLGSSNSNSIGNFNFPKIMVMDFKWLLDTFMVIAEASNAVNGGVYFLNSDVMQVAKESILVFGWVTYFSNTAMPEKREILNELKSITTDKGKYYILSDTDITNDKTEYELAKNRAISLMKLNHY